MTKIAIIVGSTRPNRRGRIVADWVLAHAARRRVADFEVVDLADHELPHLAEPDPAAMQPEYAHDNTRSWSRRISGFDGFVFVTPEYNHSIPGVLKNALDHLYVEWRDKAAGCVGYGVDGGIRGVEQLRLVLAELHVATVRDQVALSIFDDFEDGVIAPRKHQLPRLDAMLDAVVSWTDALRAVRAADDAHLEPRTDGRPPMQPPGNQPIGFWALRCGEAIRARTRGALAEVGVSQPVWWVLHQLSLHEGGLARDAMVEIVGPNDTPDVIRAAIEQGIERGLLTEDAGMLQWTSAGAEAFSRASAVQQVLAEERRRGIGDSAYEVAITVLERTIANVGGDAWHW